MPFAAEARFRPKAGQAGTSLRKRIMQAAGRHPVNDEFPHVPRTAQRMYRFASGHGLVPFPDIQLVFPAALGHEEPGLVFFFEVAADGAALQIYFLRHVSEVRKFLESKRTSNCGRTILPEN